MAMQDVYNRSLFKNKDKSARNQLKKMGGIMGSSEQLMNAVSNMGAPSATVRKMTGQGSPGAVPYNPMAPRQMGMPPQMRTPNQAKMPPQMQRPPQMTMPQQGMPMQGMPQQGMPPQGMPQQGMPPQGMPQPMRMAAMGGSIEAYPSNYIVGGLIKQGARGVGALFNRLNRAPASKPFAGFKRDPKTGRMLPGQIKNTKTYQMGQALEKDAVIGGALKGTGKVTGAIKKGVQKAPVTSSIVGAGIGAPLLYGMFKGEEAATEETTQPRPQGLTPQQREAERIKAMQYFAMAADSSPYARGMLYGLEKQEESRKVADKTFATVQAAVLAQQLELGASFPEANEIAMKQAAAVAPLSRMAIGIDPQTFASAEAPYIREDE